MVAAVIPGTPDVRAPVGRPIPAMADDPARSFEQASATQFPLGPDGFASYQHLAPSGGGANGALPEVRVHGIVQQAGLVGGRALAVPAYDQPERPADAGFACPLDDAGRCVGVEIALAAGRRVHRVEELPHLGGVPFEHCALPCIGSAGSGGEVRGHAATPS